MPTNARITQSGAEVLAAPDTIKARITQAAAEAVVASTDTRQVRVTQVAVEAVVSSVFMDACENPWSIPTPSQFPIPAVSSIPYNFFIEDAPEFRYFNQKFPDLHEDFNLNAGIIRRWRFEYQGLSEADAATLDAHYESAKSSAFGFGFTNPRTAEVLSSVRYDKYTVGDHEKKWAGNRSIVLIKYP